MSLKHQTVYFQEGHTNCSPGGVCPHLVEVESVKMATGGDRAGDGVAQGTASSARLYHNGTRTKLQLYMITSSSEFEPSFQVVFVHD